jgi:hypothetical protein
MTERKMAVDVSEELARKGQEVREITRDLDMLKIDIDVIETVIRLRGAHSLAVAQPEDNHDRQQAEPEPGQESG